MASKKAKREAGLAKREQFLADEKARGLAALEAGREAQELRRKEEIEYYMEMNQRQVQLLERHRCQKCGVLVAPATRVYHPVYCVG